MNLAVRLKKVRESLGKSQKEMAKQIGISFRAWQGYEVGKNVPGSSVIEKLVKVGFNANWILTGEGPLKILKNDELVKDQEYININFLMFIIEFIENELQPPPSSKEKAFVIAQLYAFFHQEGFKITGDSIENIKSDLNLWITLYRLINTDKGRELARSVIKSVFISTSNEEEADIEADNLIASLIWSKNPKRKD